MDTNKHDLTPVLVAVFVLIGAAVLWHRWTFPSSLPPGPRHVPIVGYLPFLGPNLHTHFTNMARNYGPIFKIWLGSKLYVVINTRELAKVVVRDQDETFANRNLTIAASIISYGGQDIGYSNNSSWRSLRKILVHEVLSNKNLEAYSSFRRDEVRKTIKNVYSKMGTKIDVSKISFSMIANVLTTMIWGKDCHLGAEWQIVISKVVEMLGRQNLSDFFPFLIRFDLQGVERETKREIKKLDRIFTSIINDRIKSNSERLDVGIAHEGKKDVLQILLELKDQQKDATTLDITKIKALITDIMLAGMDTTSSIIQWAMTEIMQNRNVMKRVQEELGEIVGPNNIVEESHLSKLKYLNATIKETLRLHPGVPLLVPRSPSQDCTVGGYTIPKGCTVFVNAWAIHRDPRNWDNPLEFNPERFLSGGGGGMDKYDFKGNNLKFLPFGSGRRNCPGVPLAEKMQTYILASLLHCFEWSLGEGEEHDFSDVFSIALQKRKPLVAIPSQRLHDVSLYM